MSNSQPNFRHAMGQTVKDVITGFSGVVVARYEYIFGCLRYSVQSRTLKEGSPPETQVFDEQQLVPDAGKNILDEIEAYDSDPGGARKDPPSRY